MEVDVRQEYMSIGCNRVANALDWGSNGLIAFGGHHFLSVFDPQGSSIIALLPGHNLPVTSVHWFGEQGSGLLASGGNDGTIIVWSIQGLPGALKWQVLATLRGHKGPVGGLATKPLGDGNWLLVSTAGDEDVIVWESSAGGPRPSGPSMDWQEKQRIPTGFQMQNDVDLALLPDPGWFLMALGGVDSAIRLYVRAPGGRFQSACRLSGHADWIRSLAFTPNPHTEGGLLLASASQDKYVRLWAIQPDPCLSPAAARESQGGYAPGSNATTALTQEGDAAATCEEDLEAAPEHNAASAPESYVQTRVESLLGDLTRYAPKPHFNACGQRYTATLEALLVGHEDWVHSVCWQPTTGEESHRNPDSSSDSASGTRPINLNGSSHDASGTTPGNPRELTLLTASMDRTMMLWQRDSGSGVWMSMESVGDAGSSSLGYYGGSFGPDGRSIVAHGFTGALHLWRREGAVGRLMPQAASGGHCGAVVDMCWSQDASCLVSVSTDQTARITAPWEGSWCEIARPQVHGHDFSCVACLAPSPSRPYAYASGSEEKVIRVLEAPLAFVATLAMARGEGPDPALPLAQGGDGAFGAVLPALGLSNKAVYSPTEAQERVRQDSYVNEGPDLAPHAAPSIFPGRPLEEHLAQNALWPETQKLYGHANELYCLAADPLGRFLASACKAQAPQWAGIWIWDTNTWLALGEPLLAHSLTVTQLVFSPDGRHLLSVSRDRTFAIFSRTGEDAAPFRLVGRGSKAHGRIIWGGTWAPDNRLFATGSRDCLVKLWLLELGDPGAPVMYSKPIGVLPAFPTGVTALAFAPSCPSPPSIMQAEHGRSTSRHANGVDDMRPTTLDEVVGEHVEPASEHAEGVDDHDVRPTGSSKVAVDDVWPTRACEDVQQTCAHEDMRPAHADVQPTRACEEMQPTGVHEDLRPTRASCEDVRPISAHEDVRLASAQEVAVPSVASCQLLAVGLQDGGIQIWQLPALPLDGAIHEGARCVWEAAPDSRHCAAVRRLCWRADSGAPRDGARARWSLASCGEDHCVRIFDVAL